MNLPPPCGDAASDLPGHWSAKLGRRGSPRYRRLDTRERGRSIRGEARPLDPPRLPLTFTITWLDQCCRVRELVAEAGKEATERVTLPRSQTSRLRRGRRNVPLVLACDIRSSLFPQRDARGTVLELMQRVGTQDLHVHSPGPVGTQASSTHSRNTTSIA